MKFDCKIIFSDIDGTFLDSRHQVQPGTAAAARRMTEWGIPVVLVSARMPAAIRPILRAAGIAARNLLSDLRRAGCPAHPILPTAHP